MLLYIFFGFILFLMNVQLVSQFWKKNIRTHCISHRDAFNRFVSINVKYKLQLHKQLNKQCKVAVYSGDMMFLLQY